jgi:hypothetical protein
MNGKGSGRRPCQVSQEQFAANWDATFGVAGEIVQCPVHRRDIKDWPPTISQQSDSDNPMGRPERE